MKFKSLLISGTIIKRYKRFLADIKLETGDIITAHVANTGAMKSCWAPGWKVLLSFHDNPKRKLKYSLEMLHNGASWIGVNTALPNKLAVEAIQNGLIDSIPRDAYIKPEYTVGKSRIDLYLEYGDIRHFIEIKSVTLKEESNTASFPDGVTTRGQKHLTELMILQEKGFKTSMLYVVQREDVTKFTIAKEIDSTYFELIQKAQKQGVEILVYVCKLSPIEINISKPLPFFL